MQGKQLLRLFMVMLPFTCCSTPAFAVMMSIPYGWYAELNGGVTNISDQGFTGNVKSSSGLGLNVNLGYKFMPFFGAEAGYTGYSKITIENQFGTTIGEITHYAVNVAVRGIVPVVDSGFEAFTRVGYAWQWANFSISNPTAAAIIGATSSRKTGNGFYFALGGQYYLSPEMAVNLQWARAKGNNSTGTIDLYSIGVSIIFA